MNDNQALRAAILDVIDEGDPDYRTPDPQWCLWHENEDFANRQRLDFADRVQARYAVLLRNEVVERD